MANGLEYSWIQGWDQAMMLASYNYLKDIMEFRDITKDATFNPDDIAQRVIAESRGDNSLEFMNLWRDSISTNMDRFNHPMGSVNHGMIYSNSDDATQTAQVTAVPVVMPYTLRVWSKSLETINQVEEAWLFWPLRNPTIGLVANMLDTDIPVRGDLFRKEISDGSQIVQRYADGRYFSRSLKFELKANIYRVVSKGYTDKIVVNLYYSLNPQNCEKTILLRTWELSSE